MGARGGQCSVMRDGLFPWTYFGEQLAHDRSCQIDDGLVILEGDVDNDDDFRRRSLWTNHASPLVEEKSTRYACCEWSEVLASVNEPGGLGFLVKCKVSVFSCDACINRPWLNELLAFQHNWIYNTRQYQTWHPVWHIARWINIIHLWFNIIQLQIDILQYVTYYLCDILHV